MARNPPSDPDDSGAAFEKAVLILNAASQTSSALAQKLQRGGYSAPAAEAACRRAVELGYVNDVAYAEALVGRRLRQGRGKALIGRELAHKGLGEETVAAAVAAVAADDELESARELAIKLVRRHAAEVDPSRRRDKVLGALARRGFSSGVSRRALADAVAMSTQADVPEGSLELEALT